MNLWIMLLVAFAQVAMASNENQTLLESSDVSSKAQRLLELENEVRELRKMRSMLASELQPQQLDFASTILTPRLDSTSDLADANSEVPAILDIIRDVTFELFILMPLGAILYLGSSAVFLPSTKPRHKSEVLQEKARISAACHSQVCAQATKQDEVQPVHFQRSSMQQRKYARAGNGVCFGTSDAEGRGEFASTNARNLQEPKVAVNPVRNRSSGAWQPSHVSNSRKCNGHMASADFEKRWEPMPFASLLSHETAAEISRQQPFKAPGCSRA